VYYACGFVIAAPMGHIDTGSGGGVYRRGA